MWKKTITLGFFKKHHMDLAASVTITGLRKLFGLSSLIFHRWNIFLIQIQTFRIEVFPSDSFGLISLSHFCKHKCSSLLYKLRKTWRIGQLAHIDSQLFWLQLCDNVLSRCKHRRSPDITNCLGHSEKPQLVRRWKGISSEPMGRAATHSPFWIASVHVM